MSIYESNYKKLDKIIPGGIENFLSGPVTSYKLKAEGYMDLNIEKIGDCKLALSHYGKQNGDCMADPDMEIRIHREMKMIEALNFQNDYMGVYQVVYPEPGKVYPKLKKELNSFLNQWLTNIKHQGHKLVEKEAS